MDKFKLFLEQAQLNIKPLDTATLNSVTVKKKSGGLLFDITFDEVMSPPLMSSFINQLQTFFFKPGIVKSIDFVFSFKNPNLNGYEKAYYDMLIIKASEKFSPILMFKNYNYEFKDNTYFIHVEKDSVSIKKYFPLLKDEFLKHGFKVNFDVIVNENIQSVKEQVERHIQEHAETLMSLTPKKEEVILDKKVTFQFKHKPEEVKIEEIPTTQYGLDKYKNEKGHLNFQIEGEVFKIDKRELPRSTLFTFSVFDETDAINVRRFFTQEKDIQLANDIKVGDVISVSGTAEYDNYVKDVVLTPRAFNKIARPEKKERMDRAKDKRIEFSLHTKMSPMDAVTSIEDYVNTLESWGHEAFAITDRNGVYAYPDLVKSLKGKKIKPIYGVELNYVNDYEFKITTDYHEDFPLKDATYVVFDLETTGFSHTRDKIIEIAAYKIKNGVIGEAFETFVNPKEKLSENIKRITNIDDEMLQNADPIEVVLPKFLEFIKGAVLVGQNASFDVGFIKEKSLQLGLHHESFAVIDTLNIARYFYNSENKENNHARFYKTPSGNIPDLKRYNLKALSTFFKVKLEAHHRAIYDAYATAEIFLAMLQDFYKEEIMTYYEINAAIDLNEAWRHQIPKNALVYAKNQEGYKNLFKLVSDTLTNHLNHEPRLVRSVYESLKEGLLIASGSYNGEVFEAALNLSDETLREKISFYDFILVHPVEGYLHLEEQIGPNFKETIQATIKKIIDFAKEQNKLVVASSNAYYLNPEDKKYRDIYVNTKSVGGGLHPLHGYEKTPNQHLHTTQEMLDAFSFLDPETQHEIVIENPKKINQMIDTVKAFPSELYSIQDDAFKDTLGVESIAVTIEKMVYEKAHQLYGQTLHPFVDQRIKRELKNIIENQFAPIYFISHLLVKKSLEDGYLVGSRGSVGSSLVATMLEITEVNPLRPHYRCPNGDFTVFKMNDEEIIEYGVKPEEEPFLEVLKEVKSGYDLPNRTCPHCGRDLIKDGHDIPFETFLGFDGDKVPDIDLNFSGDYQAKAHQYVRDLLGEDFTFRAGTIQTVAEKNAFGYVKGYLEDLGLTKRNAYIELLAKGIEGVKRSTGQHPGGIVVVPKHKTIFDVTPIQYPADDKNATWKTTHFDYHSFEDNLLKLDILGHDDPTMIKFFMDYVKNHPEEFPFTRAQDIPIDDPKVYQLFQGTEVLGFKADDVYGNVASYAIPEFGTSFTRQMLEDTKPSTFAGLVKISGLSHGTDVWLKNAQDLVLGKTDYGKISFDEIIGCRDDIMVELAFRGMKPLKAFEIMEFVRKGKPSSNPAKWAEYEAEMRANGIPEWYIWSASKIKYMFPKAHATAYVIMAMRIAWFKVYKPLLFYSGFFSKRAVQFEHDTMIAGYNAIRNRINQILNQSEKKAKEEELLVTLYVALEMTKRGYKFYPVDIHKSEAKEFIIEKDGLRMPFVSIDGLGDQVAYDIIDKRNEKPFKSIKDVESRTRVNKTVFERLETAGAFKNLSDEIPEIESGLFAID